jgi:hypothetical protein
MIVINWLSQSLAGKHGGAFPAPMIELILRATGSAFLTHSRYPYVLKSFLPDFVFLLLFVPTKRQGHDPVFRAILNPLSSITLALTGTCKLNNAKTK